MIHITTASHCLAMLRSRNAVKRELQTQGLKPTHYQPGTSQAGRKYTSTITPELIPPAIEQARAMIASGDIGQTRTACPVCGTYK